MLAEQWEAGPGAKAFWLSVLPEQLRSTAGGKSERSSFLKLPVDAEGH